MTISQIFLSQVTDPFRIALLVALIWTMLRTRHDTGTVIPLAAGVVFVAALIPATMTPANGAEPAAPFLNQFLTGLLSNGLITAALFGAWVLFARLRRG